MFKLWFKSQSQLGFAHHSDPPGEYNLNRSCAVVTRPYVKLLSPLVNNQTLKSLSIYAHKTYLMSDNKTPLKIVGHKADRFKFMCMSCPSTFWYWQY